MCEKCFDKNIFEFETHKDFDLFDKELTFKLNGDIKAIKQGGNYREVYFDKYECNHCGLIWSLSIPDNAWRGFFLVENSLIPYIDKVKKNERLKVLIPILIILIIVSLILILINN